MSTINHSTLKQDLDIVPPPPRYSRTVETILIGVRKELKERIERSANEPSITSGNRKSRFANLQFYLTDRPRLLRHEEVFKMVPAVLTASDPPHLELMAPELSENQREEEVTQAEGNLENETREAKIDTTKKKERRIIKVIFQMIACGENQYRREEITLDRDENEEIEIARKEAKTILVSHWLNDYEDWFKKKKEIRLRPKLFNYNGIRRMTTERERFKYEGELKTIFYDHDFSVEEWEKIKVLTKGLKRIPTVKSILVKAKVNEIKPECKKDKDKKKKEKSKKDKKDN